MSEKPTNIPCCQVCSEKQSHENVDRKQKQNKAPNQVGLVAGEFQTAQRSTGEKEFVENLSSKPSFLKVKLKMDLEL